ncbi:MAG: hypothetical protein AMXMBFR83_23150 [Phycisphaerae bacterium]
MLTRASIRSAIPFLALASGFAAGAVLMRRWPLRLVLIWSAAAMIAVGGGYLLASPRPFLKSPAGRRHPLSRLLLWPFDLLNVGIFRAYHRLCRRPAYDEVVPGLFLGRRLSNREAKALLPCAVLDLTCEYDENRPMRTSTRYRCLPVLDNTAPTPAQLGAAVEWLSEATSRGRVFVHCAAGHGRSAAVVLAYLLARGTVNSVADGLAFLKRRRPGVRLNAGQRAALETFAGRRAAPPG